MKIKLFLIATAIFLIASAVWAYTKPYVIYTEVIDGSSYLVVMSNTGSVGICKK